MRAGEYRDSRGNRYRNREVAMQYLAGRIDRTLGVKLHELAGKRVLVGLPDGSDPYPVTGESVIDVAFKNEFGHENVPERPFLRTTVHENMPKYLNMVEADIPAVINDRLAPATLWHRVGNRMAGDVRNAIADWTTPPNSRETQIAKGKKASRQDISNYMNTASEPDHDDQGQKLGISLGEGGEPMINNPLVDTGHLAQTIRHVVESVNDS